MHLTQGTRAVHWQPRQRETTATFPCTTTSTTRPPEMTFTAVQPARHATITTVPAHAQQRQMHPHPIINSTISLLLPPPPHPHPPAPHPQYNSKTTATTSSSIPIPPNITILTRTRPNTTLPHVAIFLPLLLPHPPHPIDLPVCYPITDSSSSSSISIYTMAIIMDCMTACTWP